MALYEPSWIAIAAFIAEYAVYYQRPEWLVPLALGRPVEHVVSVDDEALALLSHARAGDSYRGDVERSLERSALPAARSLAVPRWVLRDTDRGYAARHEGLLAFDTEVVHVTFRLRDGALVARSTAYPTGIASGAVLVLVLGFAVVTGATLPTYLYVFLLGSVVSSVRSALGTRERSARLLSSLARALQERLA